MMRSLARAFSSSRRAPPMQASKPNSSMASSSVTDWCLLRDSPSCFEHDRAALHRVLNRAHDQALAQLGGALVAEGDDFLVVVAGVDVHQREGELARAEGLLGDAQHADRVLAAGEEQHRVGALAGHFAHDVDGFGFEPVEVGEGLALGHCWVIRRDCRMGRIVARA